MTVLFSSAHNGMFKKCLFFLALLGGLSNIAQSSDLIFPTAIPSDVQAQEVLRRSLLAKPVARRTLAESKKIFLINLSMLSDGGDFGSAFFRDTERLIKEERQKFPLDAELMALEGSITCMKAGASGTKSMQAMTLVNQGFRLQDRAIDLDKMNLGARLLRAITALHVPVFLGKNDVALADFAFLLEKVPDSPQFDELRAMLHFLSGEAWEIKGQKAKAVSAWKEAEKSNSGIWVTKAKKKL